MSALLFVSACIADGIPPPVAEHRFHPTRRWRFDYAWPEHRVALEVEGGAFVGGRHTRGAGFRLDMDKYNAAAARGWRVLRCVPRDLVSAKTLDTIREALEWRSEASTRGSSRR